MHSWCKDGTTLEEHVCTWKIQTGSLERFNYNPQKMHKTCTKFHQWVVCYFWKYLSHIYNVSNVIYLLAKFASRIVFAFQRSLNVFQEIIQLKIFFFNFINLFYRLIWWLRRGNERVITLQCCCFRTALPLPVVLFSHLTRNTIFHKLINSHIYDTSVLLSRKGFKIASSLFQWHTLSWGVFNSHVSVS